VQLSLPRTPGIVRERGHFRPGPGIGGHCIGVDPWFLVEAAPDITTLIRAARKVNDTQPGFVKEENHFV
jgi:UDP-N-acetyl-D-mannosaminuronate dehydrogenase